MKYGSSKYSTIKYGIYTILKKIYSVFGSRSKIRLTLKNNINDDYKIIAQNVVINRKVSKIRSNGYIAICLECDGNIKKIRARENNSNIYYQANIIEDGR